MNRFIEFDWLLCFFLEVLPLLPYLHSVSSKPLAESLEGSPLSPRRFMLRLFQLLLLFYVLHSKYRCFDAFVSPLCNRMIAPNNSLRLAILMLPPYDVVHHLCAC